MSNPAQLLSVDDYPQRLRQLKPVKARDEVEVLAYETARLIQEGQPRGTGSRSVDISAVAFNLNPTT